VDYPADRLLVVVIANNCTDRTAEMARAAGARVLERSDPVREGKPHALAWGLDLLRDEPYDTCVIVDADSIAESSFARGVNALGPLGENAAQAYFATWNEDESWLTLLAGVFARAKYEVLYPVKDRAGLNCPLTGNGMIFSAIPLKRDGWTAFSLTENWELYADYTIKGHRIFSPGAPDSSRKVRASLARRKGAVDSRTPCGRGATPTPIASDRIDGSRNWMPCSSWDCLVRWLLPPWPSRWRDSGFGCQVAGLAGSWPPLLWRRSCRSHTRPSRSHCVIPTRAGWCWLWLGSRCMRPGG
jgi:hypothetical protein